ncbi:uncharacterized protein EKO05_0003862 [Ascochyta rabiei]|uniref:uncharacterized protein n=1 Tax=Didymella rabiei TaxID=5454 RepID=UPI0018FF3195|nr:uncharacterized protein EKO05_0003862 [Ascochyta rabiei]UPX13349.1 hypothetical protein EKO05_0003862 [Ascochyta rabiei]
MSSLSATSASSAISAPSGGPTPSAVTPPPTHSNGLAGGAVAGVAIGTFLAGLLIAGAVFFFLLRRQKKRHAVAAAAYSRQEAPYKERDVGPEKRAAVVTGAGSNIDALLPQPVEDDAITGDLSKIRDNIKNHVRTYYRSGPISATDVNEAGIRDIATLMRINSAVLVGALSTPSSRDNALRSIVASVILARCTGRGKSSLLPSELAGLSSSIPTTDDKNPAQTLLFSKWKTITGALLQQQYGKHGQDPSRAQSFQDTITSLDSVLAPFVEGSVDGGQRRKNLDMILTRAANFAFLLFTQPGSFRFDFAGDQGGLAIFPALVQTVGDQGQPLSPVKVLAEKEIVGV